VIARAIALPEAKPILQRLHWTFYRAPVAVYAESENDAAEAAARFLNWCVFVSEKFALPLAVKIRAIARDIHLADADVEAMVSPRISYFDVVGSKPDTLLVRDRLTSEQLAVRRSVFDAGISAGDLITGPLHDTGHGDYVTGLGTLTLAEDAAPKAPALRQENLRDLGPTLETSFGASTEWIDDIPKKGVRELYEELRRTLHATGDTIPTLSALERSIATADSPAEALRDLIEAANPWGEGESDVLAALFQRIWNFTPRPARRPKPGIDAVAGR
jgi:hypothetical protein